MTLLNWQMFPEHVAILSDTLSLSGDEKRPRTFMTKVYPVPHLGGVITGTGIGQLVTSFYMQVVAEMIVDDTEHLVEFAPEVLRSMWAEFGDKLPDGATTTIYTFGLSKESGEFIGFAYRSTNDFEAEELQHGTAAKPAPSMEELQAVEDLAGLGKLALKQQADDRALPRRKRVGIGGEMWLYLLTKSESGAVSFQIQHVTDFPHFAEDHDVMLAQLPQNKDHPLSTLVLARDP